MEPHPESMPPVFLIEGDHFPKHYDVYIGKNGPQVVRIWVSNIGRKYGGQSVALIGFVFALVGSLLLSAAIVTKIMVKAAHVPTASVVTLTIVTVAGLAIYHLYLRLRYALFLNALTIVVVPLFWVLSMSMSH